MPPPALYDLSNLDFSRPVFDIERVLGCEDLQLVEKRGLRPWGLFTMMRFRKSRSAKAAA